MALLPDLRKAHERGRILEVGPARVRVPMLFEVEGTMSAKNHAGTSVCCDCGHPIDAAFSKCPRCRRARCRTCDEKRGAEVAEFMVLTRTIAPIDAEYCATCYAETA